MRKLDYYQSVQNGTAKFLQKGILLFFALFLFGNPLLADSGFFSFHFNKATTCKSVDTAYPYDPVNETTSFSTGENPHAWMEITNVYGTIQGKFEWYKPDGNLYSSSHTGVFQVPNGGWVRMYAQENLYNRTGEWRVKCYISHNGGGFHLQKEIHFSYGGCACPAVYNPVCGSDGNTYGNSCEAQCAGVYTWTQGECNTGPSCDLLARINLNPDLCSQCLNEVAVYEYYGQTYLVQDGRNSGCSDALTTVANCSSGATFCLEGGIAGNSCGNFFDVATKVEVVLTDDCNQGCFCTQQYDPVCGSDGNTYGNACEAECAGIYSYSAGECNTGPSCDLLARITFSTDLCSQCLSEIAVYEYQGRTYLVQDGRNSGCSDAISTVLDCNSGATFCREGGIAGFSCGNFFDVATKVEVVLIDDCNQGCVCPKNYDPVCGSDGNTYGNACEAQCAGINTWTAGECNTCICPAVAIPVCGSDGNTYINSCKAQCAGITSWTEGECGTNVGCACTNSHADYICDDFQSYDPWQRLGPQSACWTTWTGTQGGAEDGIIQRNNNTHNQYLKIKGNNASGKLQDAVLKLGDKTWGNYTLKFKIWLFSGDKGYYNIQHQFRENATSENEWASQVYFDGHGSGRLIVKNTSHYFTYNMGEWVDVEQRIDLNNDLTDLYIGGQHVRRWKFSDQSRKQAAGTKKLSAIDFYAVGQDYEYYIDDVELSKRSNFANEAEGRSGGGEDQKEVLFADKLIVAPNPFRSTLTVTIPESIENARLSVIDQYGRVVQTRDRLDSDASPIVNLDLQDLPAGIYYVRVVAGSQILTEKVMKGE